MIYLQTGILILEIGLCMLLNNLLNNKSNKKNTIRHLYRITIKLLEYAYVSSYVGCTYTILFTCIINRIQEKKTNHLHTSFSYHIHIVTFGSVNMYTIHKTTCNIVLDHQPRGTKENIKNNIDLQLSGHTHNGQMFSLSYSYHLQSDFAGNYGKETFKHHTKIISSGLVDWGFPIRTKGICEYVVVNIKQA